MIHECVIGTRERAKNRVSSIISDDIFGLDRICRKVISFEYSFYATEWNSDQPMPRAEKLTLSKSVIA